MSTHTVFAGAPNGSRTRRRRHPSGGATWWRRSRSRRRWLRSSCAASPRPWRAPPPSPSPSPTSTARASGASFFYMKRDHLHALRYRGIYLSQNRRATAAVALRGHRVDVDPSAARAARRRAQLQGRHRLGVHEELATAHLRQGQRLRVRQRRRRRGASRRWGDLGF